MDRDFGRLWAAYTVSAAGTWLALDAFPIIAVLVLHAGPAAAALLAAAGPAAGALIALPLGPWVEVRRKRPVMIAMDLLRCAVLTSVPAAYALGLLTLTQLVVVSVVVTATNIVFTAASGAFLKSLVRPEDLLRANSRFETTMWTATALGPPLGGAAIGIFGPVTTVVADAVSYLGSALTIGSVRRPEPRPVRRTERPAVRDGWRHILRDHRLRALFLNTSLVNGLIMATAPLLAVLLLRDLGLTTLQYGLAFGIPCLGGLVGARLARPLAARFGQHRVLVVSGTLRAAWVIWLALVPAGGGGLLVVILVELGLITSAGVFNPLSATFRLAHTPQDRVVRTLSAWTITVRATTAALTVVWGLLASVMGVRAAIGLAGLLLLATPLLLPKAGTRSAAVPVGG
ncbi:MFS transporter [Actinophytocola sp.]|uniref:MFS transporter n=1 Tax=Actinophytocola sp. TaxID=1872138 RepID=UPI00389A5C89